MANSTYNLNLNMSNSKLSDKFRNSSNSSAGSGSVPSRGGKLKLKLKPRNFQKNNEANSNEKLYMATSQMEKTAENPKEKRRDRLSRGLARGAT